MFEFIKSAFAEMTHVVWPTRKESIRYMTYTVGTIVIVGIFLAILGYAIQSGMRFIRDQFPHTPVTNTTVSSEDFATKADLKELEDLANARKAQKAAASGSTQSGATATGAIRTGSGR